MNYVKNSEVITFDTHFHLEQSDYIFSKFELWMNSCLQKNGKYRPCFGTQPAKYLLREESCHV